MTFPVVLDACVLVPHPLFDTLLRLAEAELFRPLWSAQILTEVERTLTGKLGLEPAKARRRVQQMGRGFPDALVDGYEDLIPAMMNDPKDRHVLAAAVRSGASTIVTANLKDFPAASLERYEIEAVHPDAFLLDQLDLDPEGVLECLRQQRGEYTDPSLSVAEFFGAFMATVPTFAQTAESLTRGPRRELISGPTRPAPAQLPLPLEVRTDEETFAAFFPDADPDPTTPLRSAYMWWAALLDMENCLTALENLTWHPPAWNGFTEVLAELAGWSMAQGVQPNDEHPDQVAYVRLIPSTGTSAQVFADAPLPDAQVLTLVRDANGWWKVWGLSRNRMPSYGEIIGTETWSP